MRSSLALLAFLLFGFAAPAEQSPVFRNLTLEQLREHGIEISIEAEFETTVLVLVTWTPKKPENKDTGLSMLIWKEGVVRDPSVNLVHRGSVGRNPKGHYIEGFRFEKDALSLIEYRFRESADEVFVFSLEELMKGRKPEEAKPEPTRE